MEKQKKLLQVIEQAAKERRTKLDLTIQGLNTLPPEIGSLTDLEELSLDVNQLETLPPEIGNLTNLKKLRLSRNRLTSLPSEIGSLTKLSELWLSKNRLTSLPSEIGKLPNLEVLEVDDNPLTSPPPEIVHQGTRAILAFLRGQSEASRPQWVSKLLVVGEGGVGKTSLLSALRGEAFNSQEPSTHGIQIETLEIEHPIDANITMQLRVWDFGGQEIYHATHQFFLTNRSLFLVVWNARHGYEQGKLYYWLDTIQAKAPGSPILLVATHIDERDADMPFKDLCEKYPQIIDKCEVSNKTRKGIETLWEIIANGAADLPLMGEMYPATWLNAAETIRAMGEKYITPRELFEKMAAQGVPREDARILAWWMHDLGDILFFQDDNELDDIVILKPQWVSEYISMVLESEEVIRHFGILTLNHIKELWDEDVIDKEMRDHFIRLMERFDLSYRTLENNEISLVVERLSFNPPDYEAKWNHIRESDTCREISMKFRLNTLQPGIPTWFIARSHRFTTHNHWRLGAIFTDKPQNKHMALIQAYPHDRYVQLTVRGPYPQNFFALLKDGLELTFNRFPGLKIDRLMPCPCRNEEACFHEFRYEQLLKRLDQKPPKYNIECPESLKDVDVRKLLFGLVSSTLDDVDNKMKQLLEKNEEQHAELLTLLQREFAACYRREQSKIESHCPNIFTLRPVESSTWKKTFSEKIELQLYCQSPGCWHPTQDGGRYVIGHPVKWLRKIGYYLQKMVSLLKYVSPIIGPWFIIAMPEYEKLIKNDIRLMQELIKIMPDLEESDESKLADKLGETIDPNLAHGAALRELRLMLESKDSVQYWGGLQKVLTPEGHYLWLCEYHANMYRQ